MNNETRIPIQRSEDIVTAREQARGMARTAGFNGSDLTLIATAISEVTRNIVEHAKHGELALSLVSNGSKRGILIVARDEGPGIPDVPRAMEYGYSSRNGLGVGLPGARWLMDEFEIDSKLGKGTIVTMRKWVG
jgi:serine/threonine-protein kinase RsbT